MHTKSTDELEGVLGSTHVEDIEDFLKENVDDMITTDRPFAEYMRGKIKEKGLQQADIFIAADIAERYGYKILSEQKHTKQRDVILRICYAAELSLEETQKALRLYKMAPLYAKIPRDALLMIAFNTRPGNILDVNIFLKKNHFEVLKSSGAQD